MISVLYKTEWLETLSRFNKEKTTVKTHSLILNEFKKSLNLTYLDEIRLFHIAKVVL